MKRIMNITYPAFPLFALVCFALSPQARAVNPPPDGGYPNENTAEGEGALFSLETGSIGANTAIGFGALYETTTGFQNTAVGDKALVNNTIGSLNTAIGAGALLRNTIGVNNTATGVFALATNTRGNDNTATGYLALFSNNLGNGNTAAGREALHDNRSGFGNTADGAFSLKANTTGENNTATGYEALGSNVRGDRNTAAGFRALLFNTTGSNNTASGYHALDHNSTGNGNTADGQLALFRNTGDENTAVGDRALFNNMTGSHNIAFGAKAGYDLDIGSGNIDIANRGVAGDSNTIRIGDPATQTATFIAGIRDVTTGNGDAVTVVIDSAGQLGTVSSSGRFKKDVKPMDRTSETILSLKPVTFHYKSDKTNRSEFGLIAEEVAKENPNLVVRDKNGEIYTVRYEAVNAMLLNEFLKEHAKVEQLKKDFESRSAEQQKQIEALTAGLQKVSEQLELSKSAPRAVVNNR